MPLTHDFKETIRARAQRDPDFRRALLREAVECILNGDLGTGKAVLRAVAKDGTTMLGGGSELEVDRRYCPAKSGWKLVLDRGSLTVVIPNGAANGTFTTATKNAIVSGGAGARWKVEYAKRRTKVRALAGPVRVGGKVLKPGQTTTV